MVPVNGRYSQGIVFVGGATWGMARLLTAQAIGPRSVFFCRGAREVVRLVHLQPVDAFLIEAQLPDMTGFECIELLSEQCRGARFALLSDTFDAVQERQSYLLPRTHYLCRPFTAKLLEGFLLPSPAPRGEYGRMPGDRPPAAARDPPSGSVDLGQVAKPL